MNKYLKDLGVKTNEFSINDLYALEDWATGMVVKPVLGLILLFPYNKKHKEYNKVQEEAINVRIYLNYKINYKRNKHQIKLKMYSI